MTHRCDVVIPVHGALHLLLDCLESLERHTRLPHRLFLMDDGSDLHVGRSLMDWAADRPHVHVHRSTRNRGFLATCNEGIARSSAPWVCLLNSDTVLTSGWLEGLLRAGESDPAIWAVNPLSNGAVNLSVAMPPGVGLNGMAQRLAEISPRRRPDVVLPVGFCLLMRREAIDALGGFDPVYGHGYCEESDWCMRVRAAGRRCIVADDVFVWHRGAGSYGAWEERYEANRPVFDARWKEAYEKALAAYAAADPLREIRERLHDGLVVPDADGPGRDGLLDVHPAPPVEEPLRKALFHLRRGDLRLLGRKVFEFVRHRFPARSATSLRMSSEGEGVRSDPEAIPESSPGASPARPAPRSLYGADGMARFAPDARPLLHPTARYLRGLPVDGRRMRIVYLLKDVVLAGGVTSVFQLVNGLNLLGHDAVVATTDPRAVENARGLLSAPLVFRDRDDLVENFPEADVVVATFWTTVHDWLFRLMRRRPFAPVYFLQDYEPLFYDPGEHRSARRRILQTVARIPNRIVKSGWLGAMMRAHGFATRKIPLGLNRGIFYPRPKARREGKLLVGAIARPGSHERRRGYVHLVEACRQIHATDPSTEFAFFGCGADELPERFDFPVHRLGTVEDPVKVAEHMASFDLFLDASLFHGFGRPALEAMACGTATVLTAAGGPLEYARDGRNTFLVAPGDPRAMASAALRVLGSESLRRDFVLQGLDTARWFCHRAEARAHLDFYRHLLRRMGNALWL